MPYEIIDNNDVNNILQGTLIKSAKITDKGRSFQIKTENGKYTIYAHDETLKVIKFHPKGSLGKSVDDDDLKRCKKTGGLNASNCEL